MFETLRLKLLGTRAEICRRCTEDEHFVAHGLGSEGVCPFFLLKRSAYSARLSPTRSADNAQVYLPSAQLFMKATEPTAETGSASRPKVYAVVAQPGSVSNWDASGMRAMFNSPVLPPKHKSLTYC
jgi:hypothetical protein